MKNRLTFISLLCVATSFAQSSDDCKKFHSGTFTYPDSPYKNTTITRTETTQTEVNKAKNLFFSGTIRWVSDCEYIIVLDKSNAEGAEEMLGKPLKSTITKVTGNRATCIVSNGEHEFSIIVEKIDIP